MKQITCMYTPIGIKIRLDREFCSQLPFKENESNYNVLKDVENFVMTPKWILLIIGLIIFNMRLPNIQLAIVSFTISCLMALSSWIHPLFTVTRTLITSFQPRVFVYFSKKLIDKLILLVVGYITVGWIGVLYFFGANLFATILLSFLNIYIARSNFSQLGIVLQSDENAFIFTSLRYMDKDSSYLDWIRYYKEYLSLNNIHFTSIKMDTFDIDI